MKQHEDKKNKVIKKEKKKKEIKDLNINNKTKKKKNKNDFSLKEVIIVVIVTCVVSSLCTGGIMYFKYRSDNAMSYHKLSKDSALTRFVNIYADILNNYYEDVDKDGMIDSALSSMLSHLGDSYTTYLTEEEAKELNEKLSGEYQGIGIQIAKNVVYSVFKDSPAEQAGIKVGDTIIKINDLDINEENYMEITENIKNSDADTIKMVVLRDKEKLEFDVSRTTLDVPAISYKIIEEAKKKVGYLYINTFSNTASRQVKKALEEMENEGIESLILDVRGNTGGYLNAATEISELFLLEDKVIYSLESKDDTKEYKDETSEHRDYPIVVLINGGSASSSEILASALKDSYGATLVGTKSYGKGKVQTTKSLNDGGMAKYTTSKWLRPNGDCIDGKGIEPDHKVELKLSENGEEILDTQLEKAISLLTK